LMSEVTQLDTVKGETKTKVERWQPVGLTSVPLKQAEDNKKPKQKKAEQKDENDRGNDLDDDQPTGKAAEGVILHVMGQHEHAIGMFDDRRVRPYAMKEGETALYAASGTGQMLFHNNAGSYLVAVNNPAEQSKDSKEVERFASLRHATKSKQTREIKKDQKVPDHPHEGETVNLEVRATSSRIEFRAGDTVVGYYDKGSGTWAFKGTVLLGDDDTSGMKRVHRKDDLDDAGNKALEHAALVWAK